MLSNLYLHYVLDLWFERVVRHHLRGEAYWCATSMIVCHEALSGKEVSCCTRDEGGPLGAGLQEQAPNRLKLLS